MREGYKKKRVLTRDSIPEIGKANPYHDRESSFSVSNETGSGHTVHCKLNIFGHQSIVLPENGTGNDSVRSGNVSDQPHSTISEFWYIRSYKFLYFAGNTLQSTVIYRPMISKNQLSRLVSNESRYIIKRGRSDR